MQSTKRQQQAVSWVEGVMLSIYEYIDIPCELFNGDIEDAEDCNKYLSKYLNWFKKLTSETSEDSEEDSEVEEKADNHRGILDPRDPDPWVQQRIENINRLYDD